MPAGHQSVRPSRSTFDACCHPGRLALPSTFPSSRAFAAVVSPTTNHTPRALSVPEGNPPPLSIPAGIAQPFEAAAAAATPSEGTSAASEPEGPTPSPLSVPAGNAKPLKQPLLLLPLRPKGPLRLPSQRDQLRRRCRFPQGPPSHLKQLLLLPLQPKGPLQLPSRRDSYRHSFSVPEGTANPIRLKPHLRSVSEFCHFILQSNRFINSRWPKN